jgi:arsenate reductase (thioredoxin)
MSQRADIEVTELHVERAVDSLVDEFADRYPRALIERLVRDSFGVLLRRAELSEFLPTLAYRFARERLLASDRQRGIGQVEILFVGLGDTGRSQMAAGLTTVRSGGRIVAHSSGSVATASIDPAVVEVMAELDVDLGEAYAKPLSEEVLNAVDIVVTMGRSVGSVEIPADTRHVDWRVGDPSGASVDEARRVRDDIDWRVHELLAELDPGENQPEAPRP